MTFLSFFSITITFILFFTWSFLLNIFSHFLIKNKWKPSFFPLFEIIMSLCFILLWFQKIYFISYFIFFSALAITIQTDAVYMLISRYFSLYLIPLAILACYYDYLPIPWSESIAAATISYVLFYSINKIFYIIKRQHGLGQGDFELIAFIGSCTGFLGSWFSVLYGSMLGTISSLLYMMYTKQKVSFIPFGFFLCIGAIIFVLLQTTLLASLAIFF